MKIIIPNPYNKQIIDKTAKYVAENGTEFEKNIKLKYNTNSNFSFLKPDNPLYSYYLYMVIVDFKLKKNILSFRKSCLDNKKSIFTRQKSKNNTLVFHLKEFKIKNKDGLSKHYFKFLKLISLISSYINIKKLNNVINSFKHSVLKYNFKSIIFNTIKIELLYRFISINLSLILKLLKMMLFNRYSIINSSLLKDKIRKLEITKENSDITTLRYKQYPYNWDTFLVVEQIDFYDHELNYLNQPLKLKDVV